MPDNSSLVEMRRLVCGFSTTIAISAVAELGIAGHLAEAPRTAADLARLTGVNADFLRRVLRYLASEGVFEARAEDMFALTDLSHWLRSGVPGSLHPRAAFIGGDICWPAWGKLRHSIASGKSGMRAAFGEGLFDYVKSHPEGGATFNRFMAEQTAASIDALLGVYDFTGIREFVDVGGGRGALLAGVLKAYPEMRGVVFDMPEVVAAARQLLGEAGVAERCRIIGGDFFKQVPPGADLYALKYILHDWADDACIDILRNCRAAMAADGRVLVIEHVVPEESGPDFAKFMDISMLVMTDGGRERTRREFSQLLAAAGLAMRRMMPSPIGLCVLECVASSS